ncbi:MAG: aa3-type cytochrome c oxidase subunit IV [Rubellimicrobium sp.]|nr:aa3-type cytochrome c oxidase subunit IV [Rubellimicrobium sp.]
MAEQQFVHGQMDTTNQEKTFAGFIKFVTRGFIIAAVALIVAALLNA